MNPMSLNPETTSKLQQYKTLLLKWGKVINLVAPSTLGEADLRHFQDSLQLLPLIPEGAKILVDLGSGAGFPGLVLAVTRPDLEVNLVESDQKKCSFLATVSRETLTPVLIHTQRIETVHNLVKPDVITARALASLVDLLQLCEPWLLSRPDLTLIFPKGASYRDELEAAQRLYDFDVMDYPSVTDLAARILVLRQVRQKSQL
ncbi:MAG: 16S rRNA (guanine(527)-N(7))-methyltransferase RsmG [Pseudobdellovibrionaceae bacterium]